MKGFERVEYEVDGKLVVLTPERVRKHLVSGAGMPSDADVVKFMMLNKYQGLNPYLGDSYLIQPRNGPAMIIVGKDVHLKRAQRHSKFSGLMYGIVVERGGKIDYRRGGLVVDGEVLLGGWAKVYRSDFQKDIMSVVSLKEYMKRTASGRPMEMWADKPATMIQKVAVDQALRTAFPEELRGLYSQEEIAASAPENVDIPPKALLKALPVEDVVEDVNVDVKIAEPSIDEPDISESVGLVPEPIDLVEEDEEDDNDGNDDKSKPSNALGMSVTCRLRLGQTPVEYVEGCAFRTAMLYEGGSEIGVVVVGVPEKHVEVFQGYPAGTVLTGRVVPFTDEALRRIQFTESLKKFADAEKYWLVKEV